MAERARTGSRSGTVDRFDEEVGLGTIVDADGETVPFHCVEIEGGARTIDVGTEVDFDVGHKLGRVEAFSIRSTR